jgi:hypothetical protein
VDGREGGGEIVIFRAAFGHDAIRRGERERFSQDQVSRAR